MSRKTPRKTATSPSRWGNELRLGRLQMDLFRTSLRETPGAPLWPELPEEARSALTDLITQLILDHAARAAMSPSQEDGHDL